ENEALRAELDKLRKAEKDARTQAERERAARVKSANNLKQLQLAVQNFQGGKLPKFADPKTQGLFYHILPYLEQQNLWQGDMSKWQVPTYLAPSDPAGSQGSKLPKDQAPQKKEPGGNK